MRVLFATGSAASYMLPPILGDEQIMCGPDWADKREPNGRVHSLKTPVGEYDLAVIAAKLSQSQQPDVVVCLVDASLRNLPRNLAAFSCPKVLLIADTHHLTAPLMNMLRYMAAEPYDRAVFLYDRHHAAFFHAAGFRNLYWFPGLTFPHSDKTVRKARTRGVRQPQIAFVGQAGALHPFRTRMLAAMSEKRLPLTQRRLSQTDSLGFYGASLLGFNASLNGDLNLRIFEILSTGAALLTDRLAPESGLERLLADGREMLTYGSEEELIEKATHALTNPREAQAIGAAGSAWFDKHFNQAWRLSAFKSLALDGKPVPEFDFSAEEKTRVILGGDTDRLLQGLMVYETVQELHRTEPEVRLTAGPGVPAEVTGFFTSLPRLRLKSGVEAPDCDLAEVAIFGKSSDVPPEAHKVWCWDVALGEREALVARMAELGFNQINPDAAMFSPSRLIAAEHLETARMLMQINHLDKAFQHAQAAVQADPGCVEALFLISELALKAEQPELAKGTFAELEKLAPHDPRLIGLAEQLGLPLPSVAGQPPAGTGRHVLLYTDDPEAGGVAQYNHAILCALARAGYRVTCLQSRVENSLIAEQRSLGIRHRWIGYDTKQYFGRALVDGMEAQHCFQVDRPDLVLFSNCCPFSSLAAREYTRLLGIPYMVVEGFVGEYLVRNFAEHLPTLARQYAEARQVVAVSQENLQLLRSRFGLAGSAGQVIHYGRPDTFFAPRNEAVRARLRIELGLPADAIVCFTAARLAEVKRFDLQIAALEGLQKSSIAESLHCVWAGDGELREVLSREIAARGLSGRIHLIGHRWDVADWYDAADIFVLTSQTEGMPLAIMEAMAKGLPVVASAISGIPEELGGTGRLLPDPAVDAAGAVRMLAETLAQWAGDAALRTQTGQACRARAWDCFREERMVSQTLTLVESSLAVEISRPVPVAGSADGDAVPAGEVKAESQTAAVREQVVVLTDLPTHSLYSSWLKDAPFAINYVVLADLQYTFPEGTTLVVSHDCYREPQVALLR